MWFVMGKPLKFEVLADAKPALIRRDEPDWVFVSDRPDESKKLVHLLSPKGFCVGIRPLQLFGSEVK
jgi:hypothetical protein